MWRETLQRHYSDEALLAHADGELSPLERWLVVRHLKKCWQCRARLEELESQALAVARVFEQQPLLDPDHLNQARARLLRGQQERERAHASETIFLPRRNQIHPRIVAVAGTAAVLAVLGFWIYFARPDNRPKPGVVLAQVAEQERAAMDTPLAIHQTMRVEISELAPRKAPLAAGRLEIWSERPRGHFALRWLDDQGAVRHALWRGPGARIHAYPAVSSRQASTALPNAPDVQSSADLFTYGLDPTKLEATFVRWLEHWQGQPIALSSDFSTFASREGVILTVRRVKLAGGTSLFRLSAVRTIPGMHIEIMMDVDARTWKPRLQRVRFDTAQKSVEFRLVTETLQFMPYSSVPAEVSRSSKWFGLSPAPPIRSDVPEVGKPSAPLMLPAKDDLDGFELQVRYALHRIRACLGEPVEIVQTPSGRILVHGLVRNAERKRELLVALGELGHSGLLSVDIRAMSEVNSHVTESTSAPDSLTRVTAGKLPVEDQLEAYFRERLPANDGSLANHITRFTNEAVAGADAALGEAWALRRLIERYPAQKCREMDHSQQWLLEVMLRDHLAALRVRMSDTQRLVEPVLRRLAGVAAGSAVEVPNLKEEAPGPVSNGVELRTFETARHIDELLLNLFSTGRRSSVKVADAEVQGIASDLLRSFSRLQNNLENSAAEVSRSFSGPDQADSRGYTPERP